MDTFNKATVVQLYWRSTDTKTYFKALESVCSLRKTLETRDASFIAGIQIPVYRMEGTWSNSDKWQ